METVNEKRNPLDERYLVIHTIDTLTRAYQGFCFNKAEDKAKETADKISELLKKI